ncbi:MAG: site-specific integrase [Polyangia bacterium]
MDDNGRRLFTGSLSILPTIKARYTPRERFLTIEELPRLLAGLPAHRQLWVLVATLTGTRSSEVARLDWSDVLWARALVHIRGTKTASSDRYIPLHPELARWIHPLRRPTGPVVGGWPNARRDLAAAADAAHMPRISPNDLRRTFASWMKQGGVDSAVVAKLLGHTSTRMVDLVYGKLDEATLLRAVSSLPGGRAISGLNQGRFGERGEQHAVVVAAEKTRQSEVLLVPGPGIEPGTRGFSIRAFVDVDSEYAKRILAWSPSAGDRRALVDTTLPAKRLQGRRR